MVVGEARDFFVAVASAAAALTGLLFVAMSVAPRPAGDRPRGVIHQVRAAASLLAFTNALAVSLFGLVPNNDVGYFAAVLGVIGVAFTAAGLRSILADATARLHIKRQLGLIVLLLAVFGTELVAGIILVAHRHQSSAVDVVGNLLVASMLIGIARAWEFIGDRDTGIFASIAVLTTGHEHPLTGLAGDSAGPDPAGATGGEAGGS